MANRCIDREQLAGDHDMAMLCSEVSQSKNSRVRQCGASAYQWTFGKDPKLPESILKALAISRDTLQSLKMMGSNFETESEYSLIRPSLSSTTRSPYAALLCDLPSRCVLRTVRSPSVLLRSRWVLLHSRCVLHKEMLSGLRSGA